MLYDKLKCNLELKFNKNIVWSKALYFEKLNRYTVWFNFKTMVPKFQQTFQKYEIFSSNIEIHELLKFLENFETFLNS